MGHLNLRLFVHGLDGRDFDLRVESYSSRLFQSETPDERRQRDGAASFQDFYFVCEMTPNSPQLARACAEGITMERATLVLSGQGGPFMEYRLSDCLIINFQAVGSSSYDIPTDQFSLAFGKIEWVYIDQETGQRFAQQVIVRQPVIAPDQRVNPTGRPTQVVPNTAFIMMWMDPDHPELDDVCHAIKEVCRKFGVTAVRADDIEHSDQITELMVNRIASSEFVIADLTGERPNVYYEVGYAQAMGKRPILVRRQDTRIHFDLALHNVRAYKNITQLKELLCKRFEAIMGRSLAGDVDA